jgi:hypothetical protein
VREGTGWEGRVGDLQQAKERLIGENHVCNSLLRECTREMRNSRYCQMLWTDRPD